MKIGFLTDSASDILQFPDVHERLGVDVIPVLINIGDEQYSDESLSLDELLEKMNNATKSNWPKTSQPSVSQFLEHYEKFKAQGYTDVISVHVASKMSGTLNSARLASEQIEDINVHLVDTQMASLGLIPPLLKTHELIELGMEPAKIKEEVNKFAYGCELFAAVPQLDNLYKGGRLKPIRYRLGKLLGFRPILRVSHGEIVSHDKTRNLEKTQNKCYEYALAPYDKDDTFELFISHAWTEEVAIALADRCRNDYPNATVHVGRIGPSMAVHLGPGGLALSAFSSSS